VLWLLNRVATFQDIGAAHMAQVLTEAAGLVAAHRVGSIAAWGRQRNRPRPI
jgi:hypothetical protein